MTTRIQPKLSIFQNQPHVQHVALEALVAAERLVRTVPRGYGPLCDQLRRASQAAYLQTAEAAGRAGADRAMRIRVARAEALEAAAAVQALTALELVDSAAAEDVLVLLDRVCALLYRFGTPR